MHSHLGELTHDCAPSLRKYVTDPSSPSSLAVNRKNTFEYCSP